MLSGDFFEDLPLTKTTLTVHNPKSRFDPTLFFQVVRSCPKIRSLFQFRQLFTPALKFIDCVLSTEMRLLYSLQ